MLADQQPDPDPRAATSYHAFTFGWLCGELVRRIDGRTWLGVSERPVGLEMIAPAGLLQAVEAPLRRLRRELLEGHIGPLAGEQGDRT
jgi:hypothetical protein